MKWIPVVHGRHERLFDRAHRYPPRQVRLRAGLIVGTRTTCAAEWLLSYHGASRLIVDIKIAGGIAQSFRRFLDGVSITREDRSRQSIGRRIVYEGKDVIPILVVVHIDCNNRSKYL